MVQVLPLRPLFLLLVAGCLALAQPRPRLELGFHTSDITSLATDSAERFLVTSSADKTVRVWDLASLHQADIRQLKVLRPPSGGEEENRAFSAAISPDGSTIAASGTESRSVYIFDRESGRLVRRISGLQQAIVQVAYSPDGRYLLVALGSGGGIQLYRTADYQAAGGDPTYGDNVSAIAFSPAFAKDRLLATGAGDLYVRLYRCTADGHLQLLRKRIAEGKDPPVSLAFSPDGQSLAVSLEYRDGYPEVEVWRTSTLTRQNLAIQPNAMGGTADQLAWSADGKYLYLAGNLHASGPNSLIVRASRNGAGDPTLVRACGEQVECYITGIVALRDGSLVFASANQHGLGVLDAKVSVERFHPAPLPVFGGLEDYNRFLVSQDGASLRFAYRQDGASPAWFSVARRALVPGASASGFAGTPPDDKSVEVRGLGTDSILYNGKPLELDGETGLRVGAVAGGRQFLIATSWRLLLFDREGNRKWAISLAASPEAINVSGDGRLAVAALVDGMIRWFDMRDGHEVLALFPHPDQKRWILWTPEGFYDSSPGAEDLFGFEAGRGEELPAEFTPAAKLRSRYYKPEAVTKALR
jgi:WD40 repeat protein